MPPSQSFFIHILPPRYMNATLPIRTQAPTYFMAQARCITGDIIHTNMRPDNIAPQLWPTPGTIQKVAASMSKTQQTIPLLVNHGTSPLKTTPIGHVHSVDVGCHGTALVISASLTEQGSRLVRHYPFLSGGFTLLPGGGDGPTMQLEEVSVVKEPGLNMTAWHISASAAPGSSTPLVECRFTTTGTPWMTGTDPALSHTHTHPPLPV